MLVANIVGLASGRSDAPRAAGVMGAAIVATTTWPGAPFELHAWDADGRICLQGTDTQTRWTPRSRCITKLPSLRVVVWPARDHLSHTTVYFGLAGPEVRRVAITDDQQVRTIVPTRSLGTYRGRMQGRARVVLMRLPGDRRMRGLAAVDG